MMLLLIFFLASFWLWPAAPVAGQVPVPPETAAEVTRWPYYRVPENLTLCGEAVPLNEPEVREELDREFTHCGVEPGPDTMWLKRAHRYFPEIERKLRARRRPLDLKYVALAESDLRTLARSSVGALGPWQFMAPTAQQPVAVR